jgi:5-methylcytosine-specific restriction endonuclease McrA
MIARNPDLRRDEYRRAIAKHGREAIVARQLAWSQANSEHVREQSRARRLANPEKSTEYARRYRYANDPDRSKSRARKANTRDAPTAAYVEIIMHDPCAYCGTTAGTVDHITAIHAGGDNRWTNYTAACLACNGGKRERSLLTYLLMRRGPEPLPRS